MPAPRFLPFALLTILVVANDARAVNKAKLRQTMHLPQIAILFYYGLNGRGDFANPFEIVPKPEKIAEIEKELKGDATDAERYHRLAELYYQAKQPTKGREARRKAVSLFRKQLEQHPDDSACRLRLAEALEYPDQLEEAEMLVHRVVKDCPHDWHARLALGHILDAKCWQAIMGGKPFHPAGPEALLKSMRAAHPTPERIAAAQRYHREAIACFNRAIALAPHESKTYRLRGASRWHYGTLDCGLRLYKEEKADLVESFLGREAMPDLRKAVELGHQEYTGLGMVAMMETMAEFHDHQVRNPSAKPPEKMIENVSESTRKRLRKDMALLEKGAEDPNKHKAAEAAEVLGFFQRMLFADKVAAEKSLRRSLKLDPSRNTPWNLLSSLLLEASEFRKLAELCGQRLEHKDSARNRLLLAKAYEELDELDKAEQVVRAGLEREPDDFMLKLTLADLLLMRGDEEGLKQAGELLYKMREENLSDTGEENRWANYTFACGVYFGLRGDSERAHQWLDQVQKHNPQHSGIEEALKALDE